MSKKIFELRNKISIEYQDNHLVSGYNNGNKCLLKYMTKKLHKEIENGSTGSIDDLVDPIIDYVSHLEKAYVDLNECVKDSKSIASKDTKDTHTVCGEKTSKGGSCKVKVKHVVAIQKHFDSEAITPGVKCRHHAKVLTTCIHVYKKGKKKGEQCGSMAKDVSYCNKHK
jgi:hypothetical protein